MEQERPEQILVDYLLGSLPEDETEKLDQLSIEDDEFSWRLAAAENDLVDAYVRGELPAATAELFQTHYLATARRRAKVRFAEMLAKGHDRKVAAPVRRPSIWRWGLALAASVVVMASGWLFYENRVLRAQLEQERSFKADLQRMREGNPVPVELPAVAESKAPPRGLMVAAFVLAPQLRGVGALPILRVPAGTEIAAIDMDLETDDFPVYVAALRELVTGRVLWRSGQVHSRVRGEGKAVGARVPANLLKDDRYSIELTGLAPGGKSERAADYTFRVVTR